jgi:transcriptional regulator with XRE-family HTH domain
MVKKASAGVSKPTKKRIATDEVVEAKPSGRSRDSEGARLGQQVGKAVRRLRVGHGLTLGEVSERTGISRAMLSRLETGDVMPSLDTVAALTRALGVTLANLVQGFGVEASPAQLVRPNEGMEVVRRGTKRGHTYRLLAADRGPRKTFEPFLVTLNDKSEVFPQFEHPGTEFIYVLEGSLTYRHGDESYALKPGDALTFAGHIPHGPETLSKLPIRLLSVIIYGNESQDSHGSAGTTVEDWA